MSVKKSIWRYETIMMFELPDAELARSIQNAWDRDIEAKETLIERAEWRLAGLKAGLEFRRRELGDDIYRPIMECSECGKEKKIFWTGRIDEKVYPVCNPCMNDMHRQYGKAND